MLILFHRIIFLIIFIHFSLINSIIVPNIVEGLNIFSLSVTSNSSITKVQANQKYIVRLSQIGSIQIINNTLITNTSFLRTFVASTGILDFSLSDNNILCILLNETTFTILNIDQATQVLTINMNSIFKGRRIKLTKNWISVLTIDRIMIFYKIGQNVPIFYEELQFTFLQNQLKFSVCQVNNQTIHLVFWNIKSKYLFVKCNIFYCQQYSVIQNSIPVSNWPTLYVQFDSTCNYLAFEQNDSKNITVYNWEKNQLLNTKIRPNQQVYRVQFYKSMNDKLIVFYQNNSMVFYQLSVGKTFYMDQIILSNVNLSQFSFFYSDYSQLIISQRLIIYSFLTQCPSPFIFNSDYFCEGCMCNYDIQYCNVYLYSCQIDNQIRNTSSSSHQTNSTQQSSIILNQQDHETNQPFYLFQFQKNIAQLLIEENLKVMGNLINVPFMIAQSLPLALYFISFVNYWSVVSLYVIIDKTTPTYLSIILKKIYDSVNFSILQFIQIYPANDPNIQDIFKGTFFQQCGISSDFKKMHMEDFIKYSWVLIVLLAIFLFRNFIDNKTWIYKKLSFNYLLSIVAQYVSLMTSFVLTSKILSNYLFTSNIYQKLNNILNLIFIGFSLMVPFIVKCVQQISVHDDKKYLLKYRNKLTKKRQQEYNNELFYCSLCSSYLPFIIAFGNMTLIYFIPMMIYLNGYYAAKKQKQFRLNKIVLSFYFILFHISYILMIKTTKVDQLHHFFALICLLLLLIGAIHQILNLIFQFVYFIYSSFQCKINLNNSVTNEKSQNKAKIYSQQQKQNVKNIYSLIIKQQSLGSIIQTKLQSNIQNLKKLKFRRFIKRKEEQKQKQNLNKIDVNSIKNKINKRFSKNNDTNINFQALNNYEFKKQLRTKIINLDIIKKPIKKKLNEKKVIQIRKQQNIVI